MNGILGCQKGREEEHRGEIFEVHRCEKSEAAIGSGSTKGINSVQGLLRDQVGEGLKKGTGFGLREVTGSIREQRQSRQPSAIPVIIPRPSGLLLSDKLFHVSGRKFCDTNFIQHRNAQSR